VQKSRLEVVDALRGFSIAAIMLLHNIEHFDLYYFPENLPEWIKTLDGAIWNSVFFLFGGKAFAIFALLFGLTFFIQSGNQAEKGKSFNGRFVWRMMLLLAFGLINSVFYQGDILSIYALLGFFLVPLSVLNNKQLLVVSIILLLQPIELYSLTKAMLRPGLPVSDPASWAYFGQMGNYLIHGSFLDAAKGNLTNGKLAVLFWNYENGRYFIILALFLLGLLAGRNSLFISNSKNKRFWNRVLLFSTMSFVLLYFFQKKLTVWDIDPASFRSMDLLLKSWSNLAFTLVLVSGFTLLFYHKNMRVLLNFFSPMGRMSLTNYILQSVVGAYLYYGFGLGLYKHTGASYGLLIGISLTILFAFLCRYWAQRYRHGPLEGLWHKATWIGQDKN
jgi:uncharacterized protein